MQMVEHQRFVLFKRISHYHCNAAVGYVSRLTIGCTASCIGWLVQVVRKLGA